MAKSILQPQSETLTPIVNLGIAREAYPQCAYAYAPKLLFTTLEIIEPLLMNRRWEVKERMWGTWFAYSSKLEELKGRTATE